MADREGRRSAYAEHRSGTRTSRESVSATNYYAISLSVAIGFFIAIWGILRDYAADSPETTALAASSIIVVGAIVLREYFFRGAAEPDAEGEGSGRHGLSEEMHPGQKTAPAKLSVERNTELLREIKKRSDAANVLSKVPAAHKEVFEACAEYLTLLESELQRMNPGSPRLEPFLRGRVRAAEAHRFHMLRWAELEATDLTLKGRAERSSDARSQAVHDAIWVVDTAIEAYPTERSLIESRAVLNELLISIRIGSFVSSAEQEIGKGNFAAARQFLQGALSELAKENVDTPERREVADRINQKLEEISGQPDRGA